VQISVLFAIISTVSSIGKLCHLILRMLMLIPSVAKRRAELSVLLWHSGIGHKLY